MTRFCAAAKRIKSNLLFIALFTFIIFNVQSSRYAVDVMGTRMSDWCIQIRGLNEYTLYCRQETQLNRVNSFYLEIVANRSSNSNNIVFVITKQCEPRGDVTLCDKLLGSHCFTSKDAQGLKLVKKMADKNIWPTKTFALQDIYTYSHVYIFTYVKHMREYMTY